MEQKPGLASFLPLLVVFVLFYFLFIRPQQKKAAQQKKMIESLMVGDELVLTSGIICEVDSIPVDKDYLFVRFNDKNVVRLFKDAIAGKYEEKEQNKTSNKTKMAKHN